MRALKSSFELTAELEALWSWAEGSMRFERMPRVPSKSAMTWRIARLYLDESGCFWLATAFKGERVAVVRLPPLSDPALEDAWLADIEATLEQNARDPMAEDYGGLLCASADASGGRRA